MGFFNWGKKKQEPVKTSLPETLPAPPSIDKAGLPPLPKEKSTNKLRFPRMPFKFKGSRDKIYKQEKQRLGQRGMLEVIQPLFIPGSQFKDIVLDLTDSKAELKKASSLAARFEEIHELKELEFEGLRKNIETMQRKLIFMDKTLFK